MSNNVYFTEWTAKFGASWRLEIQDPADTGLSDPIYIKFPKQAVSFEDFGWEFDDIPLGIMSDTTLSVSWALSEIADLTELKDFLFNPTKTITITAQVQFDISAGNLYTLYRNGSVVYRGIQLQDYRYGMTVSDGIVKYEAELISLGKYILSCFDIPTFLRLYRDVFLTASTGFKYVIEQATDTGKLSESKKLIRTIINEAKHNDILKWVENNENDKFYFMSLADFESIMKNVFATIYNKLTRTANSAALTFSLPFMQYWKQVLNSSINSTVYVWEQLNKETALLPSLITRDTNYVGGLLHNLSGISKYKVFYDFIADMSLDHVVKYRVSPDGSKFLPYYFFGYLCDPNSGGFGNIDTITFKTNEVIELELEHYITNQITASLEEFTNADIDNYRFNDGTLRNDDELQVPVLFNTAPPANNYSLFKGKRGKILDNLYTNNTVGELDVTGDALREFRFYYTTQPIFLEKEVVVPAHSYCRQSIGSESIELEGGTYLPIIEDTKAWILRNQRECSKPLLFSDFREVLDSPRNSKLKIKVPATGDFNTIFDGINTAFYIDLTKWDSYLASYPDTWYLTKVEYNFDDDCFDLELFGSWAGSR